MEHTRVLDDQNGSPPEERPAKRRHRSAVACQRCKIRKQRCDNEFPSCSNCMSAGEPCVYGVKQMYPAEYVRSLESHIAQLERSMASEHPKVAVDHLPSNMRSQGGGHTPGVSVESPDAARAEDSSLEAGVGFVALSPNSFLGTSSGFPLAKLVKSAIKVTPRSPQRDASERRDTLGFMPPSSTVSGPAPYQESGNATSMIGMPSDDVGDRLIGAYFSRVHPKHPFISKKRISVLNKKRADLIPAHQLRSAESSTHRLEHAILHLVYAIGARYLQLANDHSCSTPEAHYAAALTDVDAISDVRSLENLEAMLLLSIYQLRSPTGPGIWWMIGTTMRHCLDCGLHRKSANASPLFDQRRKRIFWTAYMLERSVARTVGRPYAVADREIDIDLPANIDDSLETDDEISAAIAVSLASPDQITSLTAAIHIIQLQQIESRISKTVCRVDKPVGSISPLKIAKLRLALDEWKARIPNIHQVAAPGVGDSPPYSTTDYHMIQYHKALLLIFLPFLPSLTPGHPEFRQVAYSAGQICQLYKRLHDNQSYISFSLLALHANFVAGLVLVYCFCLDTSLFDSRFSSDVRACSSMLYTISERWPAARKVRSAFESLVAATIEGDHNATRRDPCRLEQTRSDGSGHFQLGIPSLLSEDDDSRPETTKQNDTVWESFETVLGDYQISSETWMQDSIFLAMDTVPAEGWSTGGGIW